MRWGVLHHLRRIVGALLAIAMVAGLLHAPSLALATAHDGIDCLGMTAPAHGHHHQAPEPQQHDQMSGKLSVCPFANATAPLAVSPVALVGTKIVARLTPGHGTPLVAIAPDGPERPPRPLA